MSATAEHPRSTAVRVLGALAASALVHGALALAMSHVRRFAPPKPQQALQVAVVDVPVPKPAPPPPPKVEPKPEPKKEPPKLARAPKKLPPPPVVQPKTVVPPSDAPPPPSQEAKQETPQPVVVTGITMESTSDQGSFTVGVGNTLYGTPNDTAQDPNKVKPYKAKTYAPVATVTEMPSLRERPDVRPYYPKQAERDEFEGDVTLRLLVDSDGSVAKAEVVSDPGEGLGAAALRLAKEKLRFNPAKMNGQAVATTITFTLHFVLN